ncbi:MAG TPA: nucleotidyl transferase AbiEii/AbiGii toxin family protein, partial [Chitinophagaceae bacterium]|nr:nucleotidyl transferase AbiEii/AbiGii toxin family protein [Chitinophagaceae bacterium]
AIDVKCYCIEYTFVEKLQTIATKFRKEMETGQVSTNYMRQYYDVFSLLATESVQQFIGSEEYIAHKKNRFPTEDFDVPLNKNEAFLLSDPAIRERLQKRYEATKALYYKGQPPFEDILNRIWAFVDRL